MQLLSRIILFLVVVFLLPSCEFKCNMGDKAAEHTNKPAVKDGAAVYNGIKLTQHQVKVNKAYLVFDNGERVPDDNFIDFTSSVKLLVLLDSGWVSRNGKVNIGASEKVETEKGEAILDEVDLFKGSEDGVSEADSKIIGLTVTLRVPKNSPPTWFLVKFRIWDKNGEGYVEGEYKLYSK